MDVISDVAFGEPFGDLEADADNYSYIKIMEQFLPALMVLTTLPWLNNITQSKLLRKYMPSDKDPSGLGKLLRYADPCPVLNFLLCKLESNAENFV